MCCRLLPGTHRLVLNLAVADAQPSGFCRSKNTEKRLMIKDSKSKRLQLETIVYVVTPCQACEVQHALLNALVTSVAINQQIKTPSAHLRQEKRKLLMCEHAKEAADWGITISLGPPSCHCSCSLADHGCSCHEHFITNSETDLGRIVCWALCNDEPHGPHTKHGVDHLHSPHISLHSPLPLLSHASFSPIVQLCKNEQ